MYFFRFCKYTFFFEFGKKHYELWLESLIPSSTDFWSVLSARRYTLAPNTPHCECGVKAPTRRWGRAAGTKTRTLHVQNGHPHRRCFNPTHQDECLMCGVCDGGRYASRGDALKESIIMIYGKWRTRQKSPCRRYGITHESMRCDETDVRYLTASWKQIPHNIPAIGMAGYQYQIPNGIYSANGSLIIIFRISRYFVDIIKRKLSQIIDLCVGA